MAAGDRRGEGQCRGFLRRVIGNLGCGRLAGQRHPAERKIGGIELDRVRGRSDRDVDGDMAVEGELGRMRHDRDVVMLRHHVGRQHNAVLGEGRCGAARQEEDRSQNAPVHAGTQSWFVCSRRMSVTGSEMGPQGGLPNVSHFGPLKNASDAFFGTFDLCAARRSGLP